MQSNTPHQPSFHIRISQNYRAHKFGMHYNRSKFLSDSSTNLKLPHIRIKKNQSYNNKSSEIWHAVLTLANPFPILQQILKLTTNKSSNPKSTILQLALSRTPCRGVQQSNGQNPFSQEPPKSKLDNNPSFRNQFYLWNSNLQLPG